MNAAEWIKPKQWCLISLVVAAVFCSTCILCVYLDRICPVPTMQRAYKMCHTVSLVKNKKKLHSL